MAETRYRGTWWLPGGEEAAQPGVLTVTDDDRLELELIGGFSVEVHTPLPGGNGVSVSINGHFPLMLGSAGGESWTLLECTARSTKGGMAFLGNLPREQEITASLGLRGIHLADQQAEVFTGLRIRLAHLLEFRQLSMTSAEVQIQQGSLGVTGQKATVSTVDEVVATWESFTFTTEVKASQFAWNLDSDTGRRRLYADEWAQIRIDAPSASSLFGLLEYETALRDLMTLAANRASGSYHRALMTDDGLHVEVIGRSAGRREVGDIYEFLFSAKDRPLAELIPAWLTLRAKVRDACNVLFGLRYIHDGYVGSRLLLVGSAAESLHRGLFPGKPFTDEEFKDLEDTACKALAGSEPLRKRQRAVIHELTNTFSYPDRLNALAAVPDAKATEQLLADVEQWVKRLRNARNRLAHADTSKAVEAELDPVAEYWLFEITYRFLCLVLLAELGCDAAQQQKAVETQEAIHARFEFRKVLGLTGPSEQMSMAMVEQVDELPSGVSEAIESSELETDNAP